MKRPSAGTLFAVCTAAAVAMAGALARVELKRHRAERARAAATAPQAASDNDVGEIDFRDVPVSEALHRAAEAARVNVRVDWPRLAAAGYDPHEPINLHLYNVKGSDLLVAIFEGTHRWEWSGRPYVFDTGRGYIGIGTGLSAGLRRVYDVRDLAAAGPDEFGTFIQTHFNGTGAVGAYTVVWGGVLVVVALEADQEKVADLLYQLRHPRAVG